MTPAIIRAVMYTRAYKWLESHHKYDKEMLKGEKSRSRGVWDEHGVNTANGVNKVQRNWMG